MRKVTLIYDCLLSERNGANTVIRQLINNPELEKKGVFVKSLSPDDWGRVGVNHDTSSKRATIKKRQVVSRSRRARATSKRTPPKEQKRGGLNYNIRVNNITSGGDCSLYSINYSIY